MLLFLSKPKRNPFLLGPCDLSLVTFLKYNFERQRWLESDFFSDHYSDK